ncbi:MAG: FtsX-like permease family protein [Treponema sp.]|nr:FtsX-like permease family protein [Treponema sp.]
METLGIHALAFKNIARNKKNSFLVILLITSITFLFFIGNTIIGSSDQGMKDAYIDSLTGEVVLQKISPVTMNLFGANVPVIDEFFTIPNLPAFDHIRNIALHEAGVSRVTSQVSTKAYLDVFGYRSMALICGVDSATYFDAFPGLILEEGHFLEPGEYGAMITAERAQELADTTGVYPEIGTPLLLTAGGAVGFKIREVSLRGIFRYKNPGLLMNEIIITDPQTARILASIQVASSDVQADEGALSLLDAPMEDLFGESFGLETPDPPSAALTGEGEMNPDSLAAYLGGFSREESGSLAGGDWNFIILRLYRGTEAAKVISSLNKKINPMGAAAVDWRTAAGTSATTLLLVQSFFNGGIILMSAAGIIAAVNILLISVFRRTKEIGTLRAIGAGDGYIRSLILGENLMLSLIAGALGVLAGTWFIHGANMAAFEIRNSLIASLFGGSALTLHFIPPVAAASFAVALVLGFAASIFPVETAVRIDPVVAVRRG